MKSKNFTITKSDEGKTLNIKLNINDNTYMIITKEDVWSDDEIKELEGLKHYGLVRDTLITRADVTFVERIY